MSGLASPQRGMDLRLTLCCHNDDEDDSDGDGSHDEAEIGSLCC